MEEIVPAKPLPAGLNGARVMVFLAVPWSRQEMISRAAFAEATRILAESHPELDIQAIVLDEDAETTQHWIRSFAIPHMEGNGARGGGSMLWLASGALVHFEMNPGPAGWKGILDRTLELWDVSE